MKVFNYGVVFQEFPDETSLIFNISNCPHRCPSCHSSYLQEDSGHELTLDELYGIINRYRQGITCIGFMGGDANHDEVFEFAKYVKSHFDIKVGWYSGDDTCEDKEKVIKYFDYYKYGSYQEEFGPLDSPMTNQVMYKREGNQLVRIYNNLSRKPLGLQPRG